MATNEKEKVSTQGRPNDLFFSILSKLPLKSLKQFGCVCKSWGLLFESMTDKKNLVVGAILTYKLVRAKLILQLIFLTKF